MRSASERLSARRKRMPSALKRGRFSSEPWRCRLSSATISTPGQRRLIEIARLEPTKPAPPVIQMRLCMRGAHPFFGFFGGFGGDALVLAVVIAAREVFLQPEVEHDEQVAAAHFFELELG